jgi:hypothetical protein
MFGGSIYYLYKLPYREFLAMIPNSLFSRYYGHDYGHDINTSVRTICNRYGIKLIELKDIDKISGHPSVKGMQQIADQVVSNMEQP